MGLFYSNIGRCLRKRENLYLLALLVTPLSKPLRESVRRHGVNQTAVIRCDGDSFYACCHERSKESSWRKRWGDNWGGRARGQQCCGGNGAAALADGLAAAAKCDAAAAGAVWFAAPAHPKTQRLSSRSLSVPQTSVHPSDPRQTRRPGLMLPPEHLIQFSTPRCDPCA